MKDPFDRDENEKLYGSWVAMGFLSEDLFIATIAETAKVMLEQMKRSVKPTDDITLVFTMSNTAEKDIYRCTGAWKCYGKTEEEQIHECKTSVKGGK